MFQSLEGKPINIKGSFKNQYCFIILSGPSLKTFDLEKLKAPFYYTMGVNNSPSVFRPNLWVEVDKPSNFLESIWRDPKITKFAPVAKHKSLLFDSVEWKDSQYKVRDCPNVVYYQRNDIFNSSTYLHEDSVNWGNSGFRCECGYVRPDKKQRECKQCGSPKWGCRSVLLAAIKILYELGFKCVFLLGADFGMSLDNDNNYAFDQKRTKSSVNNNNGTYKRLNERFDELRPTFEKNGFYVFNCTPNSGLKSFIYMPFGDAIDIVSKKSIDTNKEQTYGMYEWKAVCENIGKYTNELKDLNYEYNATKDERTKRHIAKKINRTKGKLQDNETQKKDILNWKQDK